jgi:hypothetical protein
MGFAFSAPNQHFPITSTFLDLSLSAKQKERKRAPWKPEDVARALNNQSLF